MARSSWPPDPKPASLEFQLDWYGMGTQERCQLCRKKNRWGFMIRMQYGEKLADSYYACAICDVAEEA